MYLKDLRLERCLSLRRASERMNISKSTLHRYENYSFFTLNDSLYSILSFYGFHNFLIIENKLYYKGVILNESKIKN